LVLILLIGLTVVQTVGAVDAGGGWDALGRATPRVLMDAAIQVTAGLAIALLVHQVAPRAGLWVVLAIVLLAVYPAAMRGYVRSWACIPFMLLLSLAALDAIPAALHDAAAVDRAQGWFKFRTITLPLVLPLLLAGALFRAVDAYRPADPRLFVAAYVLLILAILAGSALARGLR
jgi:ABC-type sugar transport system permease subunit